MIPVRIFRTAVCVACVLAIVASAALAQQSYLVTRRDIGRMGIYDLATSRLVETVSVPGLSAVWVGLIRDWRSSPRPRHHIYRLRT
jgi:hypothetical protein